MNWCRLEALCRWRQRLTIVLLTFNCAHRITGVLDRLREADVPIVAVDNGSHDSTAECWRPTAG